MRIGIDARELAGHVTGVGRYLAGLLSGWRTDGSTSRHEFVLYTPGDLAIPIDTRRFATRAVSGGSGTLWEQLRLPAAAAGDHLDVFFAPAYSMPARLRVPTVVTIHDISFVAHPEWFRVREGARRRLLARHAARRACAVITVSDFSRRELMEHLAVPSDKIRVIRHGIRSAEASGRHADRAPRLQPSVTRRREPRILYVGSIFNRRRVPDLIRAFAPIARAHPEASLDIVGDDRTYPRENLGTVIEGAELIGRVRCIPHATDEQLDPLYAGARAFAFLSEYEGFGFTPLEALAAGVPPVLLDTPVARETCGDAALYVRQGDLAGTTRALETLLFDEEERARILKAATAVLARYDWGRAARETMAVLESCR
jgi:glycosyltransferase involved in cell wall biosynthesis